VPSQLSKNGTCYAKVKQGGPDGPPFAASGPAVTTLLGGGGSRGRRSLDRLLLPRTTGAALAGADGELHHVVAGEGEIPPQMALRPPTQALTLLLQLLALVDGFLQLTARHLLRQVQRLPLGDQPVQRRDDLLEVRHLRQVRLEVGADQLPLVGPLRE